MWLNNSHNQWFAENPSAIRRKIAEFKGTEAAIAFQSGFNCNMGAISAVMTKEDAILSDELNIKI